MSRLAVLLAGILLATGPSLAHAREYTGSTACGRYRLELRAGDGTPGDPGSLDGALCNEAGGGRGTPAKIVSITFTNAAGRGHTLKANVGAPDPARRASIEAFLASVERLRRVEKLLDRAGEPGLVDKVFHPGATWEQAKSHARAGADVGCTDSAEMVATAGAAAFIDEETALRYQSYWVPSHCTVIVEGTVDVGELRVDGVLVRLGGGIKVDKLIVGSAPVNIGRVLVEGLPIPAGVMR